MEMELRPSCTSLWSESGQNDLLGSRQLLVHCCVPFSRTVLSFQRTLQDLNVAPPATIISVI